MGGFHSTTKHGQNVEYGDICELEESGDDGPVWLAASFVEVTEDGDAWFCGISPPIAGEYVTDLHYLDWRFVRSKDDVSFDLGAFI